MSLEFLAGTLLPLLLIVIMFGLGLTLSVGDFQRVLSMPRAVLVGLVCQSLILPAVAFGLCHLFALPPPFAIGLMLLAASPGGPTSNFYSKLSGGDVALNLTLTAVNSALSAVTLPLLTGFAVRAFSDGSSAVSFQFAKMIEIFLLVLVPVSAGMALHQWAPRMARALDRPVRIFSVIALVAIIGAASFKEWNTLVNHAGTVGWAVILFNLLSLSLGYGVARAFKLARGEAVAISFEVGIHNSGLAIFVAISQLGSTEIAVPAAVYSILMYVTAAVFGALIRPTR